MLNKLIKATLCLAMMLAAQTVFAQKLTVTGHVVGDDGLPVISASIFEVGNTANGTVSDLDGRFSISVSKGKEIEISCISMESRRIKVTESGHLEIVLRSDADFLDEVVVVGYGQQKRGSLTAAVTSISGDEVLKAPAGNVTNALAGRISGVTAIQQSGQPGADGSSLMIRGTSPLSVVDGVVRDFSQVNPEDIESISILKDAAAAAVYGFDGNTVIIVTTKKGSKDKASISYKGTYGVSQNATNFQLLDGPGYAYWYNKALELDGRAPIFTSEIVEKMKAGVDGWGNTDWYAKTFGLGTKSDHSVSVSAGNEKTRYFASLGLLDQKGNVDNFDFKRYNARLNVSSDITSSLKFELNASGYVSRRDQPVYSADPSAWNNVAQQAMRVHPYVPEYVIKDGVTYHTATATASATVNPVAAYEESGSYLYESDRIETSAGLTWNVPWVKGLSTKIFGSYDMTFSRSKSFSTPYKLARAGFTYGVDSVTGENYIDGISYSISDTYSGLGSENSLTEAAYYTKFATMQASVNYSGKFGKHNIGALALWEIRDTKSNNFSAKGYNLPFTELPELSFADASSDKRSMSGGSSQSRSAGLVARLNYNYDDKYYLEAAGRYDGTYLFAGMTGSRWGLFPSVSAGWRISQEEWFNCSSIDNLKLRGGVGLTGSTSGVGSFSYLSLMTVSTANTVVIGGEPQISMWTSGVPNVWATWSKNLNYNIGLDMTLWHGLLGVELDAFYTYKYDILSSKGNFYPDSMGGYYPKYENQDKQDVKGFDFTLSHYNNIGDFHYGARLTGSLAKRRWLYYAADAQNTPDYLKLTGKEVGSVVGFIALGLFQSEEEIQNSPTMVGKETRVGDIKYLDRNGDGKISYEQDRGYVGGSVYPRFTGGLNVELGWKFIDVNFLLQCGLGSTIALTGVYSGGIMDNTSMTKPFYHGGNSPVYLVENSWTPDNTDAYFPRLSLVSSSNNSYSSTYWYRPGDYLRLKTAQIGLSVPQKWLSKAHIQKFRVYFEGSNLLTFSYVGKYNIDPEIPSVNNGYYPQQRLMSVGINITL